LPATLDRALGACYSASPMNVLLVEDSDEVSCITVEYLHELGHQVVAVKDAETAVSRLADSAFDAVMTDVRLPGMSGLELTKSLAKTHPDLPVLIASGYGALDLQFLLGERSHKVFVLPKPYDLGELQIALDKAATVGG
jgi:CheY-like chemotaxis protein